MELKVHIQHEPQFRGTSVYLYGHDQQGEFVIEPMDLTVRHYTLGDPIDKPTLVFYGHDGENFLQAFAQALVQLGFKPDALKVSENELSATKYHLEDMRKLVFTEITK